MKNGKLHANAAKPVASQIKRAHCECCIAKVVDTAKKTIGRLLAKCQFSKTQKANGALLVVGVEWSRRTQEKTTLNKVSCATGSVKNVSLKLKDFQKTNPLATSSGFIVGFVNQLIVVVLHGGLVLKTLSAASLENARLPVGRLT